MQTPLEIHFTNMQRSDFIESTVRTRAGKLDRFFDGITSCHVYVDAAHRQHRKGNQYEVRIEVRVPGAELAVNNKPGDINAHEDVYVAIRDAFDAMERQLKKRKQQNRGRPAAREAPLQGRVEELHADEGYGHIAATDGRLVYFHANAVLGDGFGALGVGDTVELAVQPDESPKGPQASTVRPIGPLTFIDNPKDAKRATRGR